jgi:hypothetical protein
MAGGTVTISGGNVIHTFNSSGYLTPLKLVNNSLRFRKSASAYLSRTPSVTSNTTTWTWSAWVKRGVLTGTGSNWFLFYAGNGSSQDTGIYYTAEDQLTFEYYNAGPNYYIRSTAVYRDPAAWYHVVIVWDSTQATSSNRIKMYVNGSQVTAFTIAAYPTQNLAGFVNNSSYAHSVGSRGASSYFDGEMTEVNFIDGQALTPNSFGTFNSYGVWQPITYGGSYGTNGFYLPFSDRSSATTLGYDFSPAGNNWTPNNINTVLSSYTSYTSSSGTYTVPSNVTFINYLLVAGGGGAGGNAFNGGGGAGGVIYGAMAVTPGQTISYSVGAGGAGGTSANGSNGSNTTFGSLTAVGGGAGGSTANGAGASGGSGGGGAGGSTGFGTLGAGTAGQGNNGGTGYGAGSGLWGAGGGGGASRVGNNGSAAQGGNGGAGFTWINGTTYGGGGGGATGVGNTAGTGGSGGGGAGSNSGAGTSGTANTGGGGGGASGSNTGGSGGSGIVIINSGMVSTYDSMTDVPTLTSATAANYATFNPLCVPGPNGTASNGNLYISSAATGNGSMFTGTIPISSTGAKWYWEYTCGTVVSGYPIMTCWPTATTLDNQGGGYCGMNASGTRYNGDGTSNVGALPGYANGDVCMFAYDPSNGKTWMGKNGTWFLSGDPAAGTNPTATATSTQQLSFFPAVSLYNGSNCYVNFGQQPFSYAPPTNFVALNTYNL